jgi:hypothetical protein
VRAIHAISNRQGADLVQTLRERCGVEYAEDLAIIATGPAIKTTVDTSGDTFYHGTFVGLEYRR